MVAVLCMLSALKCDTYVRYCDRGNTTLILTPKGCSSFSTNCEDVNDVAQFL